MPRQAGDQDHSAGERLADWRSAERDSVAAKAAARVAELALAAATAAQEAATEVEAASAAALEAVSRARLAASKAQHAAHRASEAAQLALSSAGGDKTRADQDVERTSKAEAEARDRFHDTEGRASQK